MFTIVTLPIIPLRVAPSEQSEMVSQLLFGEQIQIIKEQNKWLYIKNIADEYQGWISSNCLNENHFTTQPKNTNSYQSIVTPLLHCLKTSSLEKIAIPGGGMTPPIVDNEFELLGEIYQTPHAQTTVIENSLSYSVLTYAKQYLNAPYLWGGKSLFGIDCSGLTQVIFRMVGINLPRDASQQVKIGTTINFLSETQSGDLAFFENNDGRITHVGILVSNNEIIHASGWVKKEIIDSQGIISKTTGHYSHKLRIVKRILPSQI